MHEIVIVGGGAGGLELATRLGDKLGRRGSARVTLIERARTHLWAERFLRAEDGTVTGVQVRDLVSGRETAVRAQLTINASGPWLDVTDREIRPSKPPLLRLTKGVHLVTPSATRHAHALFARRDGRLFFVVPWMGYSLVGTTDTDFTGDPREAAADEADVRYLAAEASEAFPGAPVDTVHYAYAGVCALVRVEGVSEGEVSRKHKVLDHAVKDRVAGIISVVGGKLTAARGIAEEVGGQVAQMLGLRVGSGTERLPLPGGALSGALGAARDQLARYVETVLRPRVEGLGLPAELAEHLGRVYGALAHEVLDLVERDRSLAEPLVPGEPAIAAEIVRATEREWAVTLADFLLRRTTLGLRAGQAVAHLTRVAETMGRLRGWDAARIEEEIARYLEEIAPMRRFSAAPVG
jgi:glycerol-3-phosphate dehydrogenase